METQASPVMYSADDVDKSINEGYQEVSDFTEWYERRATFTGIARRTYYDLRTITPDMVLTIRGIFNPTTNLWLNPASVSDLDKTVYTRWETNIGGAVRSQSFFLRGLSWLGMWPKVSTSGQPFVLVYKAMPQGRTDPRLPLASATDVVDFPEEYGISIIEFALYDLFIRDRETKKALYHYQEYLRIAGEFKVYVTRRAMRDRSFRFRQGV